MKKRYYAIILLIVFSMSLWVRWPTNTEWLSAYDPYYQYRNTNDIVENGVSKTWDEMSYYPPGRPFNEPKVMYYVTAYAYLITNPILNISLMTFCIFMAAIYGALPTIPAYMLGKELSDRNAGILSALFVGLSPAILSRTMGGFFDTDGFVMIFSLLTAYVLLRAFKKRDFKDIKKEHIYRYALAVACVSLFVLSWYAAWYIPAIFLLSLITYTGINWLFDKDLGDFDYFKISDSLTRLKGAIKKSLPAALFLILIILSSVAIVHVLGGRPMTVMSRMFTFAQSAEKLQIVNVSVAELQKINIGNIWNIMFSRMGYGFIFMLMGSFLLLLKDKFKGAVLFTWCVIGFAGVLQGGARFMLLFSPVVGVAGGVAIAEYYKILKTGGKHSLIFAIGMIFAVLLPMLIGPLPGIVMSFILLLILFLKKDDKISSVVKPLYFVSVCFMVLFLISTAVQSTSSRMEGINDNWKDGLIWLKENTPEDAVVGTWWDPGHRITGVAERRVMADGAHCNEADCDIGLNTRIGDLGKIFWTSNETEAKDILLKYKGEASEVYWIVSEDLIPKFRWLQYFGTGCDGLGVLSKPNCQLYQIINMEGYTYTDNYDITSYYGQGITIVKDIKDGEEFWLATTSIDGNMTVFQRQIHKGLVVDLSVFENKLPVTTWLSPDKRYIVIVPPLLEKSMFTRMFIYEENLEHFELVYRNEEVKIYRLVL